MKGKRVNERAREQARRDEFSSLLERVSSIAVVFDTGVRGWLHCTVCIIWWGMGGGGGSLGRKKHIIETSNIKTLLSLASLA